jgi:ABC-2 type transport system permease protein
VLKEAHYGGKTQQVQLVSPSFSVVKRACALLVIVLAITAGLTFLCHNSTSYSVIIVGAQTSSTSATTVTNNVTVTPTTISLGSAVQATGQVTAGGRPVANASVKLHMGDVIFADTKTNANGEYSFAAPVGVYYFVAALSSGASIYTVAESPNSSFINAPSAATSLAVDELPMYLCIAVITGAILIGLYLYGRRMRLFEWDIRATAVTISKSKIPKPIHHGLWIAWKDLLDFTRNRFALAMVVIMPIFMMGMVGFIFPSNSGMSDVPTALVNLDATQGNASLSTQFVSQLQAVNGKTGMMDLSTAASADEVKSSIQNGQLTAGIILGSNFTSNLRSGQQADVTLIIDQSNPQLTNLVQAELTQAIEQMSKQTAAQGLNLTDKTPLNRSLARISPYNVQTSGIVSGPSNYFQFLAPGITAMVVMMSLLTGLPHAISFEREVGTLDGLLTAPVHRMSILGGKVVAQTVRGMIEGLVTLGIAILLFGVVVHGSMGLVLGLMLLTVFSIVGLGILITSLTGAEETATMILMTLLFPMMFFSGVFFPLQLMPSYMQVIAQFFPLTHAVTALRRVVVLGAGIAAISTDVIILFCFGFVFLLAALFVFEWAMKR